MVVAAVVATVDSAEFEVEFEVGFASAVVIGTAAAEAAIVVMEVAIGAKEAIA